MNAKMTQSKKISPPYSIRPTAQGKFIFIGEEKFWVKGVTYGAFKPNEQGKEFFDDALIERDFKQMAANGINTVRIPHTMPPRSLLDIAERCGLRVMVGLSAEQYAGYLIDTKDAPNIPGLIRAKVREVAGHPALLCYAIGNEIQASLVRWIGARKVENYLKEIYLAIKSEDPEGLVTYVNYPTTEYLQLPFLDILSMNVYLETQDKLSSYLKRLQNIAGERPLLMSELGLDCIRNGEQKQAESLDWQIRTVFSAGCAGAVIFSWTDEWYRAEAEVEDWAFGLTTKDRQTKPSLETVKKAFSEVPFATDIQKWPKITIVVCSFNGASTIRDTMEGICKLQYPNYETIVVNDGSTDSTPEIVAEYPVKLISTENRGLSSARNTGWQEATGEIVAYIDDDAYPDPDWLTFLSNVFSNTTHVGVGGPNIAPPTDGIIAEAVANSPGGPVHVLLTDDIAEHIPGCNMAFRRDALAAVGGFDPRYRAAGDDVDICWQLQKRGWTLGFNAAAMDWHHRRNSFKAYWKQQIGYGKAEALLEEKWPEKYNHLGHTTWGGRLYGSGLTLPLFSGQRIYQGVMGSAPFQSLYQPAPGFWVSLPLMPEWYLLVALLGTLSIAGLLWSPLLSVFPLFAISVILPIAQAVLSANKSKFMHSPGWSIRKCKLWLLTSALHLIQPLARLVGRLRHGLTIWRKRSTSIVAFPKTRAYAIWTEKWEPPETRPYFIEQTLRDNGIRPFHGDIYDHWDLAVAGGLLGGAKMLMAIEDHGAGTQYIRVRLSPRYSLLSMLGAIIFVGTTISLAVNGEVNSALSAGLFLIGLIFRTGYECSLAMGAFVNAVQKFDQELTK